jgi:protein-disulfide isomerase
VYPGSAPDQNAPDQNQYGNPQEYEILPNYPQGPYLPDPSAPQPDYQQPGYQQPTYQQPNYQQPNYQQPGYPSPGYQPQQYQPQGYPPQGYAPQGYQPGYPPAPATVPPAPARSGQSGLVLAIAGVSVVAILAVVGVAIWAVTRSDSHPTAGPSTGASPAGAQSPQVPGNKPGPADPVGGLVIGAGPVRVDVYVDYQCPPCSEFEDATGDTLTGYLDAKRVTLSIHPVAFIDRRSLNQYSTRAAAAMACAYEQGKGLAFHAYLLSHQPPEDTAGPTDAGLATAGASIGLGAGFASCVSGGQRVAWVSQATSAAQDKGVTSVPALYVNNHQTDATGTALKAAVDSAP